MPETYEEIKAIVTEHIGEEMRSCRVEGPIPLESGSLWRLITHRGTTCLVVVEKDSRHLTIFERHQPRAAGLRSERPGNGTERMRDIVAQVITVGLLALVAWAMISGKATDDDASWLIGVLAATAFGYLLGDWTRVRRA